ncbi:MAG TPA: hypothetical protein VMI75_18435 [Polyangiaceae bacterium]|nr:hypothetical protein [Polyangiaceae bacterium]
MDRWNRDESPIVAQRRAWIGQRSAIVRKHGRAVTLAIALRLLRRARTRSEILAAVDEILVEHAGIAAFAVIDSSGETPELLHALGLSREEMARIARGAPSRTPIARVPLGAGDWMLGVIVINRLVAHKASLDAFDEELLAALGAQVAVALHAARVATTRPTMRPPRLSRPEGQ